MKLGVLGAGNIAQKLVPTWKQMSSIECYAVASRDLSRAREFAENLGFEKYYGSYLDLVMDREVQLVYVATPHSVHFEQIMLCLEHGKNVICEKAFTLNASQARQVMEKAREKHLLVCEAIWTRYMPSRKIISDLLESGAIGKPHSLTANIFHNVYDRERISSPSLGGGALLDIGVYAINFALMCFGDDIDKLESSVQMAPSGVDGMENLTIWFKDGKMASLQTGVFCRSDKKGVVYGENGFMVVEDINNPKSVSIYDGSGSFVRRIDFPKSISGYEYEFEEAIQAIKEGKTDTWSMPLDESVRVMEIMDGFRAQWGFRFPQEV